jgi:hypothetical protein
MAAVQRALKAAKEAEARSYNERRSLSKVYETLGTQRHLQIAPKLAKFN